MNSFHLLWKSLLRLVCSEYSVGLQGRAGILYREGDKKMMVGSEMLFGDFDMVIYTDTISKWLPPHDADPLSSDDRERIRQRIDHSLRRTKVEWS